MTRLLLLITALVCLLLPINADCRVLNWNEGFLEMCGRVPAECAPYKDEAPAVIPDIPEVRVALSRVQHAVNHEITYKTDLENYGIEEHYAYPTNGYGDCEDFALEKRRRLVAMGFPRRAMLLLMVDIGVAETNSTGGQVNHMVLQVNLSSGPVVLDQRLRNVVRLKHAGYVQLLYRQSSKDPKKFDAL